MRVKEYERYLVDGFLRVCAKPLIQPYMQKSLLMNQLLFFLLLSNTCT